MSQWSIRGETPKVDVRSDRIAAGTIGNLHASTGSFSGQKISGVVSPFDPRVSFAGSWDVGIGQTFEDYLGQRAFTSTASSSISLQFAGTSAAIVGATRPDGGYADIYIDGALQGGRVNTFTVLDPSVYVLGGLNATDTTISVVDTAAFSASGAIMIDDETITYSAKTGTTFTGCVRGVNSGHQTDAMVYAFSSGVNFYAPYNQSRVNVWANTSLQPKAHTLKLVVRGEAPGSSSGTLVNLSGFIVGGVIGASNLNTSIDHITGTDVPFDANGLSTTSYELENLATNQQVLGILAVAAYHSGTFEPCFASYDPKVGRWWFYDPPGNWVGYSGAVNRDVVITVLVAAASI